MSNGRREGSEAERATRITGRRQLRIDIETDLHRRLKTAAAAREVTVRDLLSAIISDWLKKTPDPPPKRAVTADSKTNAGAGAGAGAGVGGAAI